MSGATHRGFESPTFRCKLWSSKSIGEENRLENGFAVKGIESSTPSCSAVVTDVGYLSNSVVIGVHTKLDVEKNHTTKSGICRNANTTCFCHLTDRIIDSQSVHRGSIPLRSTMVNTPNGKGFACKALCREFDSPIDLLKCHLL